LWRRSSLLDQCTTPTPLPAIHSHIGRGRFGRSMTCPRLPSQHLGRRSPLHSSAIDRGINKLSEPARRVSASIIPKPRRGRELRPDGENSTASNGGVRDSPTREWQEQSSPASQPSPTLPPCRFSWAGTIIRQAPVRRKTA